MGLLHILKLQLDINDQIIDMVPKKHYEKYAKLANLMTTMAEEILDLNDKVKKEGTLV